MIGFIFLLLLALAGAAVAVGASRGSTQYTRWPAMLVGTAVFFAGLFAIIGLSVRTVGPSDVGIKTSFGHTVGGDLGPGPHWVWMWNRLTVWDNSVQHTSYEGKNCLTIRITGQQQACIDVNVWWRDNPSASDSQFRLYRTFDRFQNAYVSKGALVQYFNNVFEAFDPVQLASQSKSGQVGGATVSRLTDQVAADMRKAYTGQMSIIRLATGSPSFNHEVENALARVVTAKSNVNVAYQNKLAAAYQNEANKLLQQHLTPLVVEQNCLNMTPNLNNPSPAWNCTGSGASGVIVNGAK